jgi:hypothetical protein
MTIIPQSIADQLTPAQLLRAEGKTRKAVVDGKIVRFQRLSDRSKVAISWATFWTGHYISREEAQEAARRWENNRPIENYGFTRKV